MAATAMELKGRQPLMLMPTSVPSVILWPTGLHDKQVSNVTVIYCRYVFDFVFRICSEHSMVKVMMTSVQQQQYTGHCTVGDKQIINQSDDAVCPLFSQLIFRHEGLFKSIIMSVFASVALCVSPTSSYGGRGQAPALPVSVARLTVANSAQWRHA